MTEHSEDVESDEPDQRTASLAVSAYQVVSYEFFAHITLTVAFFVPQLGLLAFLLTSTTRVGAFLWVGVFLFLSDLLIVYFAFAGLIDVWKLQSAERNLRRMRVILSPGQTAKVPWVVRKYSNFYDRASIENSWSILAIMVAIGAFVVGTGVYIGWVWFHP